MKGFNLNRFVATLAVTAVMVAVIFRIPQVKKIVTGE
jgi:hypothetical protein